jgi:hypothetical protein
MPRKAALVVTTIFDPRFLDDFVQNFRRHGHGGDVTIFVIPDRKTPGAVFEACAAATRQGVHALCPNLDEQTTFLRRLGAPDDWIPFDSDNRRNVGFLMALDAGCEFLISIDDDNFCLPEQDYYAEHAVAGTEVLIDVRRSSDGWANLCDELEFEPGLAPYPRGFPYGRRRRHRAVTNTRETTRCALNAGLWLDDPDVDAVGRLSDKPRALRYRGRPFALAGDTWSPINTQNTAVSRPAMAAYYYVRMGFSIEGLRIDRYGDILSGYFVQKCIKHLGESVRVGDPICNHRRTPHNLFKDLYHELAGMVLIEELLPWLVEVKLTGGSYRNAYACLADELAAAASRFGGFVFDQGGRDFLKDTAAHLQTWLAVRKAVG